MSAHKRILVAMVNAVRNLFLFLLVCYQANATDENVSAPRVIRDESRLIVFELKVSMKKGVASLWGNPDSSRFKAYEALVISSEMMPRVITKMYHTGYDYQFTDNTLVLDRNCSVIVKTQKEAEAFIDDTVRTLVGRLKLLIMGNPYDVVIKGSCCIYGLEHNEAMVRHLGSYLRYQEKNKVAEALGMSVNFSE